MDFTFPDLGEGLTEGEIVRWLVKPGDSVGKDQPVLEVETDKALAEIPSPVAGKIIALLHKEGARVKVGEVLFSIETTEAVLQKSEPTVIGRVEAGSEVLHIPREEKAREPSGPLATPAARQLAKELGVDLSSLAPTGKHGEVTEEDVRGSSADRIPLRGTRRRIAEHLSLAASTVAAVTHCDRADVTSLMALRRRDAAAAEKLGVRLTFLPYVIKACVAALQTHPVVNSSLQEEEIILKKAYHIGCAVDTESGLRVPVVKDADRKSLLDIARDLATLSERARSRTITAEEMRGSTFTVTNIGTVGGMFFTPIINYPDAAILGVGKFREEPVVVQGKVEIRSVAYLCLTFDHRIFDGVEAARFLNDVIALLEHPERIPR